MANSSFQEKFNCVQINASAIFFEVSDFHLFDVITVDNEINNLVEDSLNGYREFWL